MKLLAIVIIALLLAGVTFWVLSPEESPSLRKQSDSAEAEAVIDPVTAEPVLSNSNIDRQSKEVAVLRQRIQSLEQQLREVGSKRRSAEAALVQAEYDVAELERYLEVIKTRGEEPSDYADEGVERFLPAFEAYQNAYEEREAAMARERTLTEELTIAKQALADN